MAGNPQSTTELIVRWQQGDREARDVLIRQHLPWIRERVRKRLGFPLRAKEQTGDIVQEVAMEVLEYTPASQISNSFQFRRFLATIIENVLRNKSDWYRARRRELAKERPISRDSILDLDPPSGEVPRPS